MIRHLLVSLLGFAGCLSAMAQSTTTSIANLFEQCARIEGVECSYFGAEALAQLFSSSTPVIDGDFLDALATSSFKSGSGTLPLTLKEAEEQSLFILSIPRSLALSQEEQKVVASLFSPLQFEDCELITLASEGSDKVRIFGIQNPQAPTFTVMYILYTNEKRQQVIRLLGHFRLNSSIHLAPAQTENK